MDEGAEYVGFNYPWLVFGWYWRFRNVNKKLSLTNYGDDHDKFIYDLCYHINGGYNGLSERTKLYKKYLKIIEENF